MGEHGEKETRIGNSHSSGLTEADWIGINKVRGAYERGGWDAFWSELEALDDDVMLQITIIGAFFPDVIRTAIKEELAARSVRLKDLRESKGRKVGSLCTKVAALICQPLIAVTRLR